MRDGIITELFTWEFVRDKILSFIFNTRLGGENSWCDVNIHQGY